MEREVVVLVDLPTESDRLDELLYVGLTRATTELVVIAPPELARRLGDGGDTRSRAQTTTLPQPLVSLCRSL